MSTARAPLATLPANAAHTLIADLRNIVGEKHTLTDPGATRRYRTGFRFGAGKALAEPQLAAFYRQLDPCNCFNPGIGQTSKFANYREVAA